MATSQRRKKSNTKVLAFDQKDKVKIQVNSKTWVYVKLDATQKEIEEIKKKYGPKF